MKKLSNINSKNVTNAIREYGGVNDPSAVSKTKGFGFFSDVLKRKRLEVVVPEIHYMDSEVLIRMYESDLRKTHPDLYKKVYEEKKIAKVPDNILHDLFQLHLNRTSDTTFELSEVNQGSYRLIKSMNDADMKMITNASNMNSYLTAKNIMFYLQKKLDEMDEEPPSDQGKGGKGDDNIGQKLSDALDNSSEGSDKGIDQAKEKARQEIQEMENSKDMLDQLDTGKEAGKGESVRTVEQNLKNKELFKGINLNNKTLAEMLKHSLESSVNYFTAIFTEYRESIFDSEDINEIIGLEFLIDGFMNTQLENIETVARKYKMAIDVYIDISGSMDSGYLMNGQSISCLNIAKLLALKISSRKILKDIYMFDTSISGPHSPKEMMNINSRGGTNLNTVIRTVIDRKRPSVIITDAQDHISEYSDMAYFIAVGGGRLSGETSSMKKYLANKQGIEYRQDNTFAPIRVYV
jgi:hypothetical protein